MNRFLKTLFFFMPEGNDGGSSTPASDKTIEENKDKQVFITKEQKEKLINKLDIMIDAMQGIEEIWLDDEEGELNEIAGFPFDRSFDDLRYDIQQWQENIKNNIKK